MKEISGWSIGQGGSPAAQENTAPVSSVRAWNAVPRLKLTRPTLPSVRRYLSTCAQVRMPDTSPVLTRTPLPNADGSPPARAKPIVNCFTWSRTTCDRRRVRCSPRATGLSILCLLRFWLTSARTAIEAGAARWREQQRRDPAASRDRGLSVSRPGGLP